MQRGRFFSIIFLVFLLGALCAACADAPPVILRSDEIPLTCQPERGSAATESKDLKNVKCKM